MRYFSMIFLLVLMSHFTYAVDKNSTHDEVSIKVVTEDTFPLQFVENGKISGPATALVENVLSVAGITYSIEVLPWARAYHLALTEPNVLIYSLAKTTSRAKEFKWVGHIIALDYYLYGSADSNIDFKTPLADLKQYQIGTVRDSAVYQYLQDNGFTNLTTVVQGKQNLLLFKNKRVDLFPANKSSFKAICKLYAFDCQMLKPVYKLDISAIDLHMAFSQLTDDTTVEKMRSAYKQIMQKQNNLLDIGIN